MLLSRFELHTLFPPCAIYRDYHRDCQVHDTLDQVKEFSERVRSGELVGATGKNLINIVAVGIGGSYLGPEFVHEVSFSRPSFPPLEPVLRFMRHLGVLPSSS